MGTLKDTLGGTQTDASLERTSATVAVSLSGDLKLHWVAEESVSQGLDALHSAPLRRGCLMSFKARERTEVAPLDK